MKRHTFIFGLLALLVVSFSSVSFAQHGENLSGKGKEMKKMQETKMNTGKMKGHDMETSMDMDETVIRTHTTDGVTLTYRLIDMQKRMENMEGMEKMKGKVASHHLMVNVKKSDGSLAHDARVGFLVTGPDGKKKKIMAMGMGGGHGADVDMKQKGNYKVTVKIKIGEKTVKDTFTHVAE
ncbi:hypothetical protein [Desulfoluna sp.]|uniref:hypothetical protein n=1 Tax=Desulfoluna sp. TaxID=2045199 RepID=UPI002625A181|nr:hypothetical protein [Desulfoluna sp.]